MVDDDDDWLEKQKEAEQKLLPCPFCGGTARILSQAYGYSVDCIECGAMKRVITKFLEQVIAEWNYRSNEYTTKLFLLNRTAQTALFVLKEHKAKNDLLQFHGLKNDWDGLGSLAPSPKTIQKAISWLEFLCRFNCPIEPPYVCVGTEGEICFTWQEGSIYTNLVLEKTNKVNIMQKDGNQEIWHSGEL